MAITTTQLVLSGPVEAAQVELLPAAHEARRVVLATAKVCREVTDKASVEDAASALVALRSLLKLTEESRTTIKAPLLAAGRDIDNACRLFTADLEAEEKRLKLMIGNYQLAEQRRAQEARAEAARQEALIREEQAARERERLAAARAGQTSRLESDLDTIADEADAAVIETRQAAAAVATTAAAPTGISVRQNMKFEVVDIKKLYAACPDLCTIEPNSAAIRAVIKHRRDIPGLRIWSESAAIVGNRAASALPTKVDAYDY